VSCESIRGAFGSASACGNTNRSSAFMKDGHNHSPSSNLDGGPGVIRLRRPHPDFDHGAVLYVHPLETIQGPRCARPCATRKLEMWRGKKRLSLCIFAPSGCLSYPHTDLRPPHGFAANNALIPHCRPHGRFLRHFYRPGWTSSLSFL